MTELEDIRTGSHCVFAMHVYLVFVTKVRHKVFGDRHLSWMEQVMRNVCADFEAELIEFNGENNHVHLARPLPTQNGRDPPGQRPQARVLPQTAVGVPDLERPYYRANIGVLSAGRRSNDRRCGKLRGPRVPTRATARTGTARLGRDVQPPYGGARR
ncbi:transposase [Micromonospora sp. NPDC023966]|uniref:transposase n=1 Tax=Micromonospora sp. NPDC023966 TaxID=3154699 RepID=UPI0033EB3BF6